MASKETKIAQFDSEPPASAPHEGGWYIFSNAQKRTRTDEMSGETIEYWIAKATWQEEEPAVS